MPRHLRRFSSTTEEALTSRFKDRNAPVCRVVIWAANESRVSKQDDLSHWRQQENKDDTLRGINSFDEAHD
jgi:hypothetical protein